MIQHAVIREVWHTFSPAKYRKATRYSCVLVLFISCKWCKRRIQYMISNVLQHLNGWHNAYTYPFLFIAMSIEINRYHVSREAVSFPLQAYRLASFYCSLLTKYDKMHISHMTTRTNQVEIIVQMTVYLFQSFPNVGIAIGLVYKLPLQCSITEFNGSNMSCLYNIWHKWFIWLTHIKPGLTYSFLLLGIFLKFHPSAA